MKFLAVCLLALLCVSQVLAETSGQTGCAVCQLVVGVVESTLSNNATLSKVQEAVTKLCNKIPGTWGQECNAIAAQYLPQIITWIQNKEPAATICAQIHLCKTAATVVSVKREVEQSACSICELVAQVAENYIENNATFTQIEAKMDALCADLPSPYNGECTLIVNSYLPQIVAWIATNEPPATICAQIGLCSSKAAPKVVKREIEQTPCAVCQLVVQVAESYIENNATFTQIEAKMDALCGDLPSPYNGECTLIVNSYLPQIVAWIATNEPPATACAQLGLCSSKPVAVKREVEQTPCTVCSLVVQVAETYLANNSTQTQIEAKLDALCGDLPSPYNGECVLIVNAYLPQIITWLENNEPPATLCAQLSLCSSKKEVTAH